MSAALVTGARGFVGASLARALLERGDEVVSFDRDELADGRTSTLALLGIDLDVDEARGDLLAPETIDSAFRRHRPEVVFHLAAQPIVGTAAADSPVPTFETNVRGTWNLLEACRAHDVQKVVVASSDKAYGKHPKLPYEEDFELRPTAPYEASKAAADILARAYGHFYELALAVTRFANIYGEADTNWSRLIPEAITAALDGRPPVLRSDGSPERDFLHVTDAAGAYLAIADNLDKPDVRAQAFNAGSGRPHRVGRIVELIAELADTGVEPEILGDGNPRGEIDRQWVDSSKIERLCGWKPAFSIDEGLARTIEWYRAHAEVRPPA